MYVCVYVIHVRYVCMRVMLCAKFRYVCMSVFMGVLLCVRVKWCMKVVLGMYFAYVVYVGCVMYESCVRACVLCVYVRMLRYAMYVCMLRVYVVYA